ncbi:salivary glue protein Sgs-3-like [Mytilus edulis]|uniref:salivary glue protein Sgs-3-like n=1 Tax=Mytilus edulis TaxID=6550 RepID=UPI0039EF8632
MTDKTTSDPTDTTSKTIQLTSISNIVGLTTRTIGSISEKHVTTTKGTATVSVTHGPISDETTYTAVTTLVKTTAGQASVSPITNDKPSEIIASSETQTKPSTFIYDTPTTGFTTDDTTMTYTTTSEATVKAEKNPSNLPRYLILLA